MSSSRNNEKDGHSKLKELLNCAKCSSKYDKEKHVPLVLPCSKTICKSCVLKGIDEESNTYPCYFCHDKDHAVASRKLGDFPKNDIILALLEAGNVSIDSSRPPSRVNFAKSASENAYKFRKLNAILNQAEANSVKLDASVKQSRELVLSQYSQIESEINARANQLMDNIRETKNELLKELNTGKKSAITHIDECYSFNKECQKNHQRLVEAKTSMGDVLDDIELKSVCLLADELNERILKTNEFLENDVKTNFKFQRTPSTKAEQNLIGRLELSVSRPAVDQQPQSDRSGYLRTLSIMSPLPLNKSSKSESSRSKTMHFKLPYKCKNMILAALSNKSVVKVIESVVIDEYSYVLNLSLVNNSFESSSKNSARLKVSEDIGPFRLKKVQTSMSNNYILVHLVNKFLTSLNHLKLYNAELKCVKSLDVNYIPVEVFMNKQGIYALAVSDANKNHLTIHRYDYELNEQEVFNFVQYTKLSSVNQEKYPRHYFIEKNLKLVGIENEKFYFFDSDHNRVSIVSRDGGVRTVKIGEEFENDRKELLLIRVDAVGRINVLNRKLYKVEAFNESGQIVGESKLDTRVQSIDSFFAFEADKSYCVIDRKNCVVNFT